MRDKISVEDLERAVVELAFARKLFEPGEKVLVLVSGGPDSVALLHLLHRNSGALGIRLHVFHLDHMLRGETSRAEADFVEQLCARLKIGCSVVRMDVRSLKRRGKDSMQDVARHVRRSQALLIAKELSCTKIATGHHLDDRIETFFMRVMRGTGEYGLGSIRHQAGMFVRPLLDVQRSEIMDYIEALGLSYCTDLSNEDLRYARTRLRSVVLPELFRSGSGTAQELRVLMDRFEERAGQMDALARAWAEQAQDVIFPSGIRHFKLDLNQILELDLSPGTLVRALFLAAFQNTLTPERGHIQALLKAIRDEDKAEIDVVRGVRVKLDLRSHPYFMVVDSRTALPLPDSRVRRKISFDGKTALPELGVVVSVKKVPVQRALEELRKAENPHHFETYYICVPSRSRSTSNSRSTSRSKKASRAPELFVALVQPGDCIGLRNGPGTRKISDILIDQKVPREQRAYIPVLRTDDEIMLLPGYGPSAKYAVSPGCQEALRLVLSRYRPGTNLNPL